MKYVFVDENPYHNGTYTIFFNAHEYDWGKIDGHVQILGARLLGLSYSDYLRYCRKYYNAEIIGKRDAVPRPHFKDKKSADKLAKIFNERIEAILNEKGRFSE